MKRIQNISSRQVQPGRIPAVRIQVARQGNARIARQRVRWIGDQLLERDHGIGDLVNERRVGAVLEEAAHEIGEEVGEAPHRRVDAAGDAGMLREKRLVERIAHAEELLELEFGVLRQIEDRRDRAAVVGRKRGADRLGGAQQACGAGHVGKIGRGLVREHGIVGHAELLGALDLAVPVRALDETDGKTLARVLRQRDKPVADRQRALLVGLDGKSEGEIPREGLVQIEGQLEALGFLRVDREDDVPAAGDLRELPQHGKKLRKYARALRLLEARVERRELDRDRIGRPGGVHHAEIRHQILAGVFAGARRLAQHVEGKAVGPEGRGARCRIEGGLGDHELAGKYAHRLAHGGAHDRIAQPREQVLQRRGIVVPLHQPAGEEQRPVRGARGTPVAAGEVFAQQRVLRGGVRDAQQRLGDAHQRDALARRQAVQAQERFGAQCAGRRGAHRARKRVRIAADALGNLGRRLQGEQALERHGFGRPMVAPQRGAQLCEGEGHGTAAL